MFTTSTENREEKKDRVKSAIITAILWSALLLFLFLYQITTHFPKEKEEVTTMLINFGDNTNGNGAEEPANQDGSLAANTATTEPPLPTVAIPQPEPPKKLESEDKILAGQNPNFSVPRKTEKTDKPTKNIQKITAHKPTTKPTAKPNSALKTGNGDGKGNAAIGNLIRGKGTKVGSQGNQGSIGNAGDPLGGSGNGDSRIGVDRQLIAFIPGTMGRGGAQPKHGCNASGTIYIAYVVDKAGNIVSAKRTGGTSDPCIVSTSISWVKQFVKAEKGPSASTGTYKITF